jgi:acyl-coenzyme A synthetase/AMP-(fatty) acid ligase
MKPFFLDNNIDYQKFVNDVILRSPKGKVEYSGDLYIFLVDLFSCLIHSINIEIIEIDKIPENYELFNEQFRESILIEEFLAKVFTSKSTITLFTSGTTGSPKKVEHQFDHMLQNIRINNTRENNVWALTYNPTHMAGLQVILQIVLNLNPFIFLFRAPRNVILEKTSYFRITHISGTPTFFKLLMPCDYVFDHVKRVTTGGEKLSEDLLTKLIKVFPNSKFTNIYATTEYGSILFSSGETFEINENNKDKVRIFNNELQINKNGSDNYSFIWEGTGDIVEIINYEPIRFKFTTRNINFVNIGGERVNLDEVESKIQTLGYIKLCRVFLKKTSIINILCVDIVLYDNIKIENHAIKNDFKKLGLLNGFCPQIINFVDFIEVTKNGKTKR